MFIILAVLAKVLLLTIIAIYAVLNCSPPSGAAGGKSPAS